MANIGDILSSPEEGWKRYEDNDSNISYIGSGWLKNESYDMITEDANGLIKFNFTRNKLRILGYCYWNRSDQNIFIDGINYGQYKNNLTSKTNTIIFEKIDLNNREHCVEIKNINNATWFGIDAIDIDANGELKPYNEKILPKYLIKQNNQYYTLQENGSLYLLGVPEDNTQLENWFNNYGISNINDLCTKYNIEQYISSGEALDEGKLFTFNIPDIMKNINNVN